ncbi:uncharacterized protein LOC117226325 isoform X1 [Megalopta genalis]|uniref:uncharacterized protein LOC117226325 isoform X1 n=2 Tax=Megalopta genalis TaxID=115081 RepID=UPI003FD1061A
METEEVYSLAITPPIISRFAVQWSEDNHISVLTEKGIHVFEFIPNPMSPYSTIKFSRSFIYAPLIFPTEGIKNKIESKIWDLSREEICSFLMEESMTPKVPNVKEMIPKIVDLAWSPQNLMYPNNCLLAILTTTGAVLIVQKISTDWYPTYDLSTIRYNAMEKEITVQLKDTKDNSMLFLTLKNCIKTLQASCMTWSMLFVDFAYLAISYQNGDVIIYKVPSVSYCSETEDVKIVGTIRLNDCARINALHWISIDTKKHIIIIGYLDGRIHGLSIGERDQIIELRATKKYYEYADRIPISIIRAFPRFNATIRMLISKGSFLFLLHLATNGTLKSIQHIQLEGFMISGLTYANVDCALVTTENNLMFMIDTRNDNFSKLQVKNVWQQAHPRYLGLAHSLSYMIFVNVTSPNSVYDHLVMKEPSKLHFFVLKHESWDPCTVLKKNKGKRLERIWDCLEMIRMKATKAENIAAGLPKTPSILESLPLNELRITMWISVIMEISEKKKVIQGIGSIAGEVSEAQPLIFIHTACDYLERLDNNSSLFEEQQLSIYLLKMYFEVYLAGEENEEITPVSKRARKILKRISDFNINKVEACNLCGEVIHDLSWKVTKCSRGHILPRCAITLLQITGMQYKICRICGLIFHPCLDQVFGKTSCLFCDMPAHQENRVLGSTYFPLQGKSLSRHGNHVPDDREAEAASDET